MTIYVCTIVRYKNPKVLEMHSECFTNFDSAVEYGRKELENIKSTSSGSYKRFQYNVQVAELDGIMKEVHK